MSPAVFLSMDLPRQIILQLLRQCKGVILLLELTGMLKYCRSKSPFIYLIINNKPSNKTLSLMKRVKHICPPYALNCLHLRIRSYMGWLSDLIYSFSQTKVYGAEANWYRSDPKSKALEIETYDSSMNLEYLLDHFQIEHLESYWKINFKNLTI